MKVAFLDFICLLFPYDDDDSPIAESQVRLFAKINETNL